MQEKNTSRGVCLAFLLACGLGGLTGEEPVIAQKPSGAPVVPESDKAERKASKEPWLGIYVSKPSQAVLAQIEDVPEGVGFVIDKVAPGSPAAEVGLREFDFIWKMDGQRKDQLLINIGQFLTLLGHERVGDTVTLTVQRGGENQDLQLVVAPRPEHEKGRDQADVAVMAPPIPGMPRQIVNVLHKVAELRDDEGAVRIWRLGEGFGWAEYDQFDLEIRSGELAGTGDEALPPDLDAQLKAKLEALVRAYQQAERNQHGEGRSRVRRVPDDREPRRRRNPDK